MKMPKETIKKAVAEVNNGASIAQTSRKYSIDRGTLRLYFNRYKDEKDKAFEKRDYSLEEKLTIVRKHLDNGQSISFLSSANRIQKTTIKRWVKAYLKDGEDGLRGKRQRKRDQKQMLEDDLSKMNAVISDTFKYLNKKSKVCGRTIRKFFSDNKAF